MKEIWSQWRYFLGGNEEKCFLVSGILGIRSCGVKERKKRVVPYLLYLSTSHASDCTVIPDTPYLPESYPQNDPQPCEIAE